MVVNDVITAVPVVAVFAAVHIIVVVVAVAVNDTSIVAVVVVNNVFNVAVVVVFAAVVNDNMVVC